MEISNSVTPTIAANTKSDKDAISSDFETFIKMLTAQMENQDPLNPLDSQDFATQLATFSGVEQQVKTNDLLGALGSQMALSGLGDIASWVGMEARIAAPVDYTGDPVELSLSPATIADNVELVIKNEAGTEVNRVSVAKTDDSYSWNGTGTNGQALAHGAYSFELVSRKDGEIIDTKTPEAFVSIDEVRLDGGAAVIVLQGGTTHPATSVRGLR
jgi:flagellar basal-body rod modification protein FlgD